MGFYLEHLPENVHLVISSRSDSPLPLGRLRARAEMNEIRTEQVAFKSIYRKLGVSSRKEAVEEAHARGLV